MIRDQLTFICNFYMQQLTSKRDLETRTSLDGIYFPNR